MYNNESELRILQPLAPTHFRREFSTEVSNQQQTQQPSKIQQCLISSFKAFATVLIQKFGEVSNKLGTSESSSRSKAKRLLRNNDDERTSSEASSASESKSSSCHGKACKNSM